MSRSRKSAVSIRSLTRAKNWKSARRAISRPTSRSPQEVKMGDTITDARNPSRRAAGLQGNSSDGVQRDLSDQHGGLRASEIGDGEVEAERFGVCLFGGNERGAGLRFSLRLSRLVAHGNRAGTAAPRIRHGHHRDVSERGLSRHADGRHVQGSGQPGVPAGRDVTSRRSRSRW